jgi:thioredoxin-related protein
MNSIRFAIVFIFFLLNGCKEYDTIDYPSFLESSSIKSERYVLIIPQNGCSTCVKKAYDFILENIGNANISYVFTHYSSKKAVKVRLNVFGVSDLSKVSYIDTSIAQEHGISTFYPTLIELFPQNGLARAYVMNKQDMSDWSKLAHDIK